MDEQKQSQKQMNNSALMATNGLLYKMPQALSVCVNRTFKKEYSQRQSYSAGDTIVFDINSGSSYIDPSSCMLSFNITTQATTANGADRVSFGTGMASNLIKEIRVLSKNGCEVDRTQNAHALAKILKDYTYSSDSYKTLTNAGLGSSFENVITHTFIIPLSLISGFFRPIVSDMKIPAGLASGLRIEFLTETAKRALTYTGAGTNVTYTISDPEMLFMCMDLNDPTQAVLMQNSAQTGLEYTFPSFFSTPLTTVSDRVNKQVKKAVANSSRAFAVVYNSADIENEKKDGFSSIDTVTHVFNIYNYRVGSNYYPKKDVTNISEAFYVTSACFDKTSEMQKFAAPISLAEYANGGKIVIGVPIETDSLLNLSGVPLNNSNVLELRAEISASGASLDYLIFIEHVTVARTFVNSTSIKE